jgi:uncharacterized protein involved in exopolysaccharide biosynthesis
MDTQNDRYYTLADISQNFTSFLRYLKRKWLSIIVVSLLGMAFGFGYFYIQKPKYKAVSTFILEEKSAGGGGLAGIASQFGLNLGSLSGGGSIFAGDNILNILKSKTVVQKVLLSQIELQPTVKKTLADYYLDFSGHRKSWDKKPHLQKISFENTTENISPIQDSVLNAIYDTFIKNALKTERIEKQGTIIEVKVVEQDPLFARLMTERLIDEASKLYLDIRTGTATSNIKEMQRRSDSLLYLLNRKSFVAAASQPLGINPGIRTASVPVEIANRDKAVLSTLYAEVTKNLEASKMMLAQQTPVIQLLDKPGILLDDNKMSLLFLLIVFTVGALMIYIGLAFTFFFLFGLNKKVEA